MQPCETDLAPAALALAMSAGLAQASTEDDRKAVAALDTEFQAAVKHHDAATIDRIQHPDMVLVLGDGRIFTKADHVQAALDKKIQYEIQDEDPGTQTVRVLGDTAVVTARLWLKGTNEGSAIRPARLVQRHLCEDARGLEVLLRPGLSEAARRGGEVSAACYALGGDSPPYFRPCSRPAAERRFIWPRIQAWRSRT